MKKMKSFDISRRDFMGLSLGLGATAALTSNAYAAQTAESLMKRPSSVSLFPENLTGLTLPPLPYSKSALLPTISQNTVEYHYEKHTKGYYDNLTKLLADPANERLAKLNSLELIVKATAGQAEKTAIFNNASQALNHSFYFAGLKASSQGPAGALAEAINRNFGDLVKFKTAFSAAAVGRFGSGWAWLVVTHNGQLKITTTANADSPILNTPELHIPLFVVDVWEHAYYLDFQNLRAKHVNAVLDNLVNWDFVSDNYQRALEDVLS